MSFDSRPLICCRARWTEAGQPFERTQTVQLRPGAQMLVNLTVGAKTAVE